MTKTNGNSRTGTPPSSCAPSSTTDYVTPSSERSSFENCMKMNIGIWFQPEGQISPGTSCCGTLGTCCARCRECCEGNTAGGLHAALEARHKLPRAAESE